MSKPHVGSRRTDLALLLVQALIGSLFAYAGVSKLVDGSSTIVISLNASGWFSPSMARIVAVLLPWSELTIGIWLASGQAPRAALIASSVTFSCFIIVLLRLGIATGWGARCGCMAPSS